MVVQNEMALVLGSSAVEYLGQVRFKASPEVHGLADVRSDGGLSRDPSLDRAAADEASTHRGLKVLLERWHDNLVALGLLVADDDRLPAQLEEIVPLAQEVLESIPEVVLRPDVDVDHDVRIHVIRPAHREPLKVRHPLDYIDQPDRSHPAHYLGTHRCVGEALPDVHIQGPCPESLFVNGPPGIFFGLVPGGCRRLDLDGPWLGQDRLRISVLSMVLPGASCEEENHKQYS